MTHTCTRIELGDSTITAYHELRITYTIARAIIIKLITAHANITPNCTFDVCTLSKGIVAQDIEFSRVQSISVDGVM